VLVCLQVFDGRRDDHVNHLHRSWGRNSLTQSGSTLQHTATHCNKKLCRPTLIHCNASHDEANIRNMLRLYQCDVCLWVNSYIYIYTHPLSRSVAYSHSFSNVPNTLKPDQRDVCSVLQYDAVWCSALQCVVVCCSVLQCVAVCSLCSTDSINC